MKTIIYRFIVLIILFSCYKINTFGNDQTDYSENINSNNSLSLTEKSEKYFNLARVEYGNEKEVKFLHLALHYAQRDGNIDSQAKIYKNLIRNFYNRNQTDSVLYWGEEAKFFSRKYNMYDLYFDCWGFIVLQEIYFGNKIIAMENAKRIYEEAHLLNNKNGMITSYECQGILNILLTKHKDALEAFILGLELAEVSKAKHSYIGQFMAYIIKEYLELKDAHMALNMIERYNELLDNFEDGLYADEFMPIQRCRMLSDCFYMKAYIILEQYGPANHFREDALMKYDEISDPYVRYVFESYSAEYFHKTGDYEQALEYVDKAMEKDNNINNYVFRADILTSMGHFEEASEWYKQAFIDNDAKYDIEYQNEINYINATLKVDKLLADKKETELKSKNLELKLSICVSCFLFLMIIGFAFYVLHITKIKNQLLASSKELLFEKECLAISESELREAKDKAEESNRLKSAFLQNMSHEIRTPLNAVVGFSGIIASQDLDKYEKEYFGEVIRNNSDLLINLINDILDLSRLESGNMQIIYEEKDLNDICRSCLDTISVNVPPEVKLKYEPEFEQLIIKTDEQRLQQILINFLNNASKFTQTGSISLSYRLNRDENFIDISVTDTGCGIPEEKKDIIFERFAKVDEFSQGTGLGLPICKLISNLMGGKVFIDENYTEGARFTMRHPLK